MATSDPIHFFDLYSDLPGPSKSWSPNTLKTRAVLNFKGLPYTQSWISYPDITPLLSSLSVAPNNQGRPYTLPAILHKASIPSNPNGAMMDSLAIAHHLDALYPSPSLFPSGKSSVLLFQRVSAIMADLEPGYRPLVVPRVAEHLDPRGQAYFRETRTKAFGKPFDEIRPTDPETLQEKWEILSTHTNSMIALLRGKEEQEKTGPFFEGDKAGYADLVYASQLAFIERFDKEFFGRILELGDGEIKALYEACVPWLEGAGEDREWVISTSV
ncbi:hypothetical protein BJX99DRAFT_238240 [Aspergillus californicus]